MKICICVNEVKKNDLLFCIHLGFYPTALKGCRGIVYTHDVQMSGRAGGGKKFVRAVSQKP